MYYYDTLYINFLYIYIMEIVSGIYKIQSRLKPDRVYIGSSVDIHLRWGRHLYDLLKNRHRSFKLQNHFNKYGKPDLAFSILTTCEKDELIQKEQFFIDSINPWFNIAKVAGNPMLGRHQSEETKNKLSKLKTGVRMSVEAIEKSRQARLGIKQSPETIAKRVAKNTGKKRTEETKKKMSVWQKGKPKPEEARRNMSIAQKGHKGHVPWNKGLPARNRGVSPSEETKAKLRILNLGKKQTPETIAKRIATRMKNKKLILLSNDLFN